MKSQNQNNLETQDQEPAAAFFEVPNSINTENYLSHWKPVVAAWNSSDMTKVAFCAKHKISIHKLKYWVKRLGEVKQTTQPQKIKQHATPHPQFVDLRDFGTPINISESSQNFSLFPQQSPTLKIELELQNGIKLKIY